MAHACTPSDENARVPHVLVRLRERLLRLPRGDGLMIVLAVVVGLATGQIGRASCRER